MTWTYKVLIIEDDEYNRSLYSEVLGGKRCELFFAEDDVSGFAQYQQVKPDLILLDLRFGEREVGTGPVLKDQEPSILRSRSSSSASSRESNAKIQALKHGAYDYLEKPITRETLSIIVDRVLGKIDLIRELKRLQSQEPKVSHGNIITRSPALLAILKKAEKVAETDVTVLLTGETGTGKELVARYIFSMSRRRQAPFSPGQLCGDSERADRERTLRPRQGVFYGRRER